MTLNNNTILTQNKNKFDINQIVMTVYENQYRFHEDIFDCIYLVKGIIERKDINHKHNYIIQRHDGGCVFDENPEKWDIYHEDELMTVDEFRVAYSKYITMEPAPIL